MTTPAAPDPRLEVILDEARRALARQGQRIDEVRGRAIAILSVASVAITFVGGVRFGETEDSSTAWMVAAVVIFVGLVLAALLVLWPREWLFVQSASKMIDADIDTDRPINDMLRAHALDLESNYDHNDPPLRFRTHLIAIGCGLLGAEVVVLVLDLICRR